MKNLTTRRSKSRNEILYGAVGVVAMLVGWQLLSMVMHKAIVASPLATLSALKELVVDGRLWQEMFTTLRRLLIGLSLGTSVGLSFGIIAGLKPNIRSLLEPVRWVGMTIPAIVIAVLAMLWFGMGNTQVIFMVAVIVTPLIYVNTLEGILAIDDRIIEMSRVYRFPRRLRLTEVYLPGIGSAVIAGLTLAAGVGVRAVVLAELMGAFDGVGHSFNRAWTFLNTPELFAWVLACLAVMGLLEFGILGPIRRHLMKWREEDAR